MQILYLKHHDNVYKLNKLSMAKKLTKFTKSWFLQSEQTYPTVQTVTDNAVKYEHTL